MNKQICIIILLLTCTICNAQNLVPNGDFEQFIGCPTLPGQTDSCLYWFNPIAIPGGSDYFNACAPWSSGVSVPSQGFGFQIAHSGVAYCGLFLTQLINNIREYIEVPILSPLNSGTCYHFEMFVNLHNTSNYTTNEISVYFSDTIITNINSIHQLPYSPQITNPVSNTFDTLNWTLLSGNYTAIGGENYLVIGNFKNDSSTYTLQLQTSGYNYAYVYIDDVSLTPCTGIYEQNNNATIYIYPNPINNKLFIATEGNESFEIILYDIASRKILQQKFTNSASLNTEQLAKGLYLYEVRGKNGLCKKGKVVKD